LKSCCVLQDHCDDERDKTVFHNTTPDLQDQDQDRLFWSQTGLVLRPTVWKHITDEHSANEHAGNDRDVAISQSVIVSRRAQSSMSDTRVRERRSSYVRG